MSTSWNAEIKLRSVAEDLHSKAYELERAADVLKILRESDGMKSEIKDAESWAKSWLKK